MACIAMGVVEGYTMLNYGDPDLEERFEYFKSWFPSNNTMSDNVTQLHLYNTAIAKNSERSLPYLIPVHYFDP
jgi:hypothetical protein